MDSDPFGDEFFDEALLQMCDAIEMQHGLVQEEVPAPESHLQAPMGAGGAAHADVEMAPPPVDATAIQAPVRPIQQQEEQPFFDEALLQMCDAIEMQHGLVHEDVPAPESHFQAPMGAGGAAHADVEMAPPPVDAMQDPARPNQQQEEQPFFDEALLQMCDAIEMQHGLVHEEVPAPESHFQAPIGAGGAAHADVVMAPLPVDAMQDPARPIQQKTEQPARFPSIESLFAQYLDLPHPLAESYKRRGVTVHYDWQEECLRQPGVVDGRNILYAAPTSGGKSFVAEVLLLRRVLLTRKKALFVLPFVAVVREKVKHLRGLLTYYNNSLPKRDRIRIKEFHGGKGGKGLGRSHIAVCTIEKANALINKMIEDGKLDQLTCLVVDELHMVADKQRGYLLEIMLSKLKYIQSSGQKQVQTKDVPDAPNDPVTAGQPAVPVRPPAPVAIQIIGMSATLPNLEEVADWMGAVLYRTNFRPVNLLETYVVGDKIYDGQGMLLRTLSTRPNQQGNPDNITTLTRETCSRGDQVILFCPSRRQCEVCATILASALLLTTTPQVLEAREALIRKLTASPGSLDPTLASLLKEGVAFHHAGLTDEEKQGVEDGFRSRTLAVLVATTTLGAGINLPVARVIFRSVKAGPQPMEIASYRQMAGRAGRAGHMTYGESILIAKNEGEAKEARRLMTEGLPRLESCLWPEADGGRGLVRAILEAVTAGALRDGDALDAFLRGTLMAQQVSPENLPRLLAFGREALAYLCDNRMVELEPTLAPTKLGRALFHSSFSPDEGLLVFHDLVQARRRLILDCPLHLLYLLTPVAHNLKPDFGVLWTVYQRAQRHDPSKAQVFELVGLQEAWLDRWSRQPPNVQIHTQALLGQEAGARKVLEGEKLGVLRAKRMWAALMLSELVQERKLEDVATQFQAAKGEVQSFQAAATTFCGMVQAFLAQLDWMLLSRALGNMVAAVSGQPAKELQPLFQLPHMRLKLAQALFSADLRSVAAVAAEPEDRLAELLRLSQPFDVENRPGPPVKEGQEAPVCRWLLAARRLKGAANGVLEREDKARRTRLHALQAQWGSRKGEAMEQAGDEEAESESDDDESRASGDEEEKDDGEDEEEAIGQGLGGGDLSSTLMPPMPEEWDMGGGGQLDGEEMLIAGPEGDAGGGGGMVRNAYDTPLNVRDAHKHFRSVDFPSPVTPLAPSPGPPTTDRHFMYSPHQHRRLSMSPPNHDRPAQHACTRAGLRLPPLSNKLSCDGLRAAHLPSPQLDAFLSRCRTSRCFALVLNFRGLPSRPLTSTLPKDSTQLDNLRFLATSSMPDLPLRSHQIHSHGLLTGVSISLDGRECYYISLPPPFRHRPFPTHCLGDPPAPAGPDTDAMQVDPHGDAHTTLRMAKLPRVSGPSDPEVSVAQRLPDAALAVLFGFLGFTHGPQFEYGGLDRAAAASRNAAYLACRRWNRAGCQWFNAHVSRRAWKRVKGLMGAQDVTKIVWDAATAMTALQERGVEMAGPLEDPKVGMWLLAHTAKFQLILPPPENQVDCLAFPAGGIMRLAACVETLLESHRLMQPFRLTEMPLVPTLCEMQFYGMRIARSWFPQVLLSIQERLLRLQELANAYGRCEVNLRSGESVQNMLYAVLRLKPPPRWVPKTSVFNSKPDAVRKAEIGPTNSDMLELMVDQSPAAKVVVEYRSLCHTLTQLQTFFRRATSHYILGSHRVRPKADATGSSTGRVILSDPALQHVQHEITLQHSPRVSIQDEIDLLEAAAADLWDGPGPPAPVDLSAYVGLPVAVLRATAHWGPRLQDKNASADTLYATSQLGVLREVLPRTIGVGFQTDDGADTTVSLADYWRTKGFAYTDEEEGRVRQLCIEFDGPEATKLTYPADKVFRQCGEITDPDAAAAELFSGETQTLHPREAFRAADGYGLLSADYSQIEMRLLAHFSGDPLLCSAFRSGKDVFKALAATWKGIAEDEVTPAVRNAVKQLAYALIYGQGAEALGQQLKVTRLEAQKMQADFLKKYPGLKTFATQTRTACKERGFVETLLGRRRYLPNINSDDSGKQAQAERQALNTVCQGSAADLIKLAMINIHHHIHTTIQPQVDKASAGDAACKSSTLRALGIKDCRLVLQVHDELVYEVRSDLLPEMRKVVRRCMEGAVKLQVPLRVNLKEGGNWGQMAPVEE